MKMIVKKWIGRSAAFLAVLLLLSAGIPSSMKRAEAARKPTLLENSMTIGYGTMGTVRQEYNSVSSYSAQPYCINLTYPAKRATYSYSSSNTKVVQVKTVGDKGYLTGKAKGTAVITCTQKLKGKTTTIGTCKVSVKASSLVQKDNYRVKDITIQIGKGKQEIFRIPFILLHRNNGAEYTYVSSSKNLIFSEKFEVVTNKETKDKDIRNSMVVYAKKTGNYTITVKETFQKKTRTIGSFKVVVDESKYQNILTMAQGESEQLGFLFEKAGTDIGLERKYEGEGFKLTESGHVVRMEETVDGYGRTIRKITAQKPGMAVINVYSYNPETKKKGLLMERYLIEVTEPVKIEERTLQLSDESRDTYVGERYTGFLTWTIRANPLGTWIRIDQMTISSSDETVLKLKLGAFWVSLLPKKAGTATITISYGELSKTCKVTVYENEEALLESKNWIGTTFKLNRNDTVYMDAKLLYPSFKEGFYLEGDGFDILDKNSIVCADSNDSYSLFAANKGSAKINVYEYEAETKTKGNLVGSFFVEVSEPVNKEIMAEEIVLSKDTIETYLGVNPYGAYEQLYNNSNYFQWAVFPPVEEGNSLSESGLELWGNFSGSKKLREKTSITFSDPEILTLKKTVGEDIEDDEGHLLINPKKAGKTTITFQCDTVSTTCDVTVYANKAEYEKAVENRLK